MGEAIIASKSEIRRLDNGIGVIKRRDEHMQTEIQRPPIRENQIEVTYEYEVFERMSGNRPIDEHWVAFLMRRMQKKDLKTPIQVNQNFEVVDGQHRLEARKRLGFPVYYYVTEDMHLEEVQEINANVKKWTLGDHVDSFIELGKRDYEIYKWFRKQYDIPHEIAVHLLTDRHDRKSVKTLFLSGSFKVKDLEKAKRLVTQLARIGEYFKQWNTSKFMSAMLVCMNKRGFDFEKFMRKLESRPTALKPQATTDLYVLHIEEIFNYGSANKISLKYGEDIHK